MALIGDALIELGLDATGMDAGSNIGISALKKIEAAGATTGKSLSDLGSKLSKSFGQVGLAASAARQKTVAELQAIAKQYEAVRALVSKAIITNVKPTAQSMLGFLQKEKVPVQGLSAQPQVTAFTTAFTAQHAAIRAGQGATEAGRAGETAAALRTAAAAQAGALRESTESIAAAAAQYRLLGAAGTESLNSIQQAAKGADEATRRVGGGARLVETAVTRLDGASRKLKPAISLLFSSIGAFGPISSFFGAALLQLSTGISAVTIASGAAIIGIVGFATALNRRSEQIQAFDEALRTNNSDFFIKEIDRLNKTIRDLDATSSTYLGRVLTRLSQFSKGESFFPGTLRQQVQDLNAGLQAVRTEKLEAVTEQLDRQRLLANEPTQTGKIALEGKFATTDAIKDARALRATSDEVLAVGKKVRETTQAQIGAVARDFVQGIKDQNAGLQGQVVALTQSKEAAIDYEAGLIRLRAKQTGVSTSSKELNDQIAQFRSISLGAAQATLADQLTKQNQALRVQITEMTSGKAAAEELALQYQLADSKLKNYGAAALAAAAAQRQLNDEAAKAVVPQALRELADQRSTARATGEILGPTFNAAQAEADAIRNTIEGLLAQKDPRARGAARAEAIKLKVELDQASLRGIQTELASGLALDEGFADLFNRTFTNTFDEAASRVDRLTDALERAREAGLSPLSEEVQEIGRQLDDAQLAEAFGGIERDLKIAQAEAQLLGRSFNLPAEQVGILQQRLRDMLERGLSPARIEVQNLARDLQAAKVDEVFGDLSRDLETSRLSAEAFGGSFDQVTANINALTNAIKRLIEEGLDPLDPRIQDLRRQLEDQEMFRVYRDAAEDAFDLVTDGLLGNIKSWEDFGNRVKGILDDLAAEILRHQFRKLLNEIFKPPEVSVPGGGGGAGGFLGSIFGSLFGGGGTADIFAGGGASAAEQAAGAIGSAIGLQGGGHAVSGRPYIVGERAPELFVPDASGSVIPIHKMMGAGGGQNNTFNFHGVQDMDSFRRSQAELSAKLSRAVRKGDRYN
jgi:hypothetical protein